MTIKKKSPIKKVARKLPRIKKAKTVDPRYDLGAAANLSQAMAAGRWMSAVFWVAKDGDEEKVYLQRVTNQFPIANFPLAIQLLTDNLKELQ